jgi:hypothetical protein
VNTEPTTPANRHTPIATASFFAFIASIFL